MDRCWPGIVHRLDRDTSGVIIVAKSDQVHAALAAQWQARTIKKEYFAIVVGAVDRDRDTIDRPIGVHPQHREKMAIRAGHATTREAHSFDEVDRRFSGFSTLRVWPSTGRTHQIRVHLAHIGCPVLCDRLYGGRSLITLGELKSTDDATVVLDRQALHGRRLSLTHPVTNVSLEYRSAHPARFTMDARHTPAVARSPNYSRATCCGAVSRAPASSTNFVNNRSRSKAVNGYPNPLTA